MRRTGLLFLIMVLFCLFGCAHAKTINHVAKENEEIGQSIEITESKDVIEQCLYSYYREYALFGDEDSELLEIVAGSTGEVYLQMRDGCYEELKASITADNKEDSNEQFKVRIHRADKEVLSLLKVRCNDNGEINYISHSYDVESGRELELKDVVTDIEQIRKIVCEQSENSSLKKEDLKIWTIGYEGLTIYLQTGTVKALPIYISYEQHPDLFEDRLKQEPSGYAVGFDQYCDLVLDVDKDGTADIIQMKTGEDENSGALEATVWMGSEKIVCQLDEYAHSYATGGYFVKNNDGKMYMYIYTNTELDYQNLYCVIKVDETGLTYVGDSTFNFDMAHVITNPERVTEAKECEEKGVGFDVRYVYVNSEGFLEGNNQMFYCGELYVASEDMEGKRINPENGMVQEDAIVIQGGESVILLRTDYQEYKDYILVDGSICRVDY